MQVANPFPNGLITNIPNTFTFDKTGSGWQPNVSNLILSRFGHLFKRFPSVKLKCSLTSMFNPELVPLLRRRDGLTEYLTAGNLAPILFELTHTESPLHLLDHLRANNSSAVRNEPRGQDFLGRLLEDAFFEDYAVRVNCDNTNIAKTRISIAFLAWITRDLGLSSSQESQLLDYAQRYYDYRRGYIDGTFWSNISRALPFMENLDVLNYDIGDVVHEYAVSVASKLPILTKEQFEVASPTFGAVELCTKPLEVTQTAIKEAARMQPPQYVVRIAGRHKKPISVVGDINSIAPTFLLDSAGDPRNITADFYEGPCCEWPAAPIIVSHPYTEDEVEAMFRDNWSIYDVFMDDITERLLTPRFTGEENRWTQLDERHLKMIRVHFMTLKWRGLLYDKVAEVLWHDEAGGKRGSRYRTQCELNNLLPGVFRGVIRASGNRFLPGSYIRYCWVRSRSSEDLEL